MRSNATLQGVPTSRHSIAATLPTGLVFADSRVASSSAAFLMPVTALADAVSRSARRPAALVDAQEAGIPQLPTTCDTCKRRCGVQATYRHSFFF